MIIMIIIIIINYGHFCIVFELKRDIGRKTPFFIPPST